jgi:O-antigen ligase
VARSYGQLSESQLNTLYRYLCIIAVIWALTSLSQSLIGWRIHGIELVSDYKRPRGLYSHPLTLAYTAFLFWPLAVHLSFKKPKSVQSWLLFLSIGTIIVLTNSRTIQFVSLVCLIWNGAKLLRGNYRWLAVVILIAGFGVTATTNNTIRAKFRQTFSSLEAKHATEYQVDRLAFWDAHRLMIQDRPMLGHGHSIDSRYRAPYYQELGLAKFTKKYEAHNAVIQLLTNGGVIGLCFFLFWFVLQFQLIGMGQSPGGRAILTQTFIFWALAAMSQNSFQDSEARLALAFAATAIVILPRKSQPLEGAGLDSAS